MSGFAIVALGVAVMAFYYHFIASPRLSRLEAESQRSMQTIARVSIEQLGWMHQVLELKLLVDRLEDEHPEWVKAAEERTRKDLDQLYPPKTP